MTAPERTARDVVVDALTARHEELSGEASPRGFDGASQILRALTEAGYQITAAAELRREVRFSPSYDHRDEPGHKGCGSVIITFILAGPLGAISADISTGWLSRPYLGRIYPIAIEGPLTPRGNKPGVDLLQGHESLRSAGVYSHCPEQRREHWYGPDECTILGGPCYGDKGYLVGDQFLEALVAGGDEAAWKWLEDTYNDWLRPEVSD